MEELMAEILDELKIEYEFNGEDEEDIKSLAILEVKLKNAIREVKSAFGFKSYHTDEFILKNLQEHIGNIKDLTMYDYALVGTEGEISHREKNITREYKSRKDCFSGIVRFAD